MEGFHCDGQCSLFESRSLADQVFVLTGRLSVPRVRLAEAIRCSGGVYRTTVSHNTTILVVGSLRNRTSDGLSKKLRAARRINAEDGPQIRIIGQEELYHMLEKAVNSD